LGGKNVIFKTTTNGGAANLNKPSMSSQIKNKNLNIIDDQFPVEIIKTQDLRPQKDPTMVIGNLPDKKTIDAPSF
jgi:hypothetical protein